VAATAIAEILAAEGAPVVVTAHAALGSRRGMMHERLGRADLSALLCAGTNRVAVGAGEAAAVCGVTEADVEGARRLGVRRWLPGLWQVSQEEMSRSPLLARGL
jgi:hypothetical protein